MWTFALSSAACRYWRSFPRRNTPTAAQVGSSGNGSHTTTGHHHAEPYPRRLGKTPSQSSRGYVSSTTNTLRSHANNSVFIGDWLASVFFFHLLKILSLCAEDTDWFGWEWDDAFTFHPWVMGGGWAEEQGAMKTEGKFQNPPCSQILKVRSLIWWEPCLRAWREYCEC